MKTDSQLKVDISKNEGRAKFGAWLIIGGLVIEVILAIVFPSGKTFIENWAPVGATALIAIGVYVEILFSGKAGEAHKDLQISTETKLTDALTRAEKTEQELITLKTPRRRLFAGKTAELSAALQSFTNVAFDIGVGPNDGEVADFIWDIEDALRAAGWQQVDWR
jgi:hypothetical protein